MQICFNPSENLVCYVVVYLLMSCNFSRLAQRVGSPFPPEALRLASEELVWFREQGHKRGQAQVFLTSMDSRVHLGSFWVV